MHYKEYAPSALLQGIVQQYWAFEIPDNKKPGPPIQHETLPDSCVSIVLIDQPYFKGVRILGPHVKKFEQPVFPGSVYFGIKLLPWIVFKPELICKAEVLNKTSASPPVIEQQLSHHDLNLLGEGHAPSELIEHKLAQLFGEFDVQEDELVKYICLALNKGNSIAAVVEQLPFSIRVIQKKFKAVVGLTMREYAYNIKQRNIWIEILDKKADKLEVALKYHYYDQAHFINDFKKKMNRSHRDFEAYMNTIRISIP